MNVTYQQLRIQSMFVCMGTPATAALRSPELAALKNHAGPLVVNGKTCANLPTIWDRIEADTRKLAENAIGCVIHGDLCFSNILYDLRSQICKFVAKRVSARRRWRWH